MGSWFQKVTNPLFLPTQEAFAFEETATAPLSERMVYSSYHNALFAMAPHTIYKISLADNRKEIFYASAEYEFQWMDISRNGELLVILTSPDENSVKIFHRNLFNILAEVTSTQSLPTVARFVSDELVVGCVSYEQKKLLRFLSINYLTKIVKQNTVGSSGHVINLMQLGTDSWVAATSTGELYAIDPTRIREEYTAEDIVEYSSSSSSMLVGDESSSSFSISGSSQSMKELESSSSSSSVKAYYTGVHLVGTTGTKLVAADLAGRKMADSSDAQKKVRIFVGSQKWSNDRWDSGEIETDKVKMAYGGGNNLEPGQKYYVHILVNYTSGVWSTPQVSEFVVPKY